MPRSGVREDGDLESEGEGVGGATHALEIGEFNACRRG